MVLDPFVLLGRIVLAAFQIVGYSLAYGFQALWSIGHSRRDKVGDAVAVWGKAVIDSLVAVFRR